MADKEVRPNHSHLTEVLQINQDGRAVFKTTVQVTFATKHFWMYTFLRQS